MAAEAMAGERTWMDVASSMAAVARNYLPEQVRVAGVVHGALLGVA